MDITVIVPVFNGGKTIVELNDRISLALNDSFTYEILYVHDHGKDNSLEVIEALVLNHPDVVRGFSLDRNYGQHNAILFGISKAKGKYIITLDEDLQHDPAVIIKLVEKQREGDYDVVYAMFEKLKHPDFRIRTSELLRRVLRTIVPGIFPGYSPYRLIKKDVAVKMLIMNDSYTFIDGYLARLTSSFGFVNADHFTRASGESSYSYFRLFRHASLIIIAQSYLRRRLLLAACILLLASIALMVQIRIAGGGTVFVICLITGLAGLLLLFKWSILQFIHISGVKNNPLPKEFTQI